MTEKKISVLLNSDGDRAQMDQSIQSLMNQSSGYWRDTELLIFLKKEECQDENADLKEYLQILKMKNPQIKIVEYEDSIWKAYDEAVEIITAPYLIYMKDGDAVQPDTLLEACQAMDSLGDATDLSMMDCLYQGKKSGGGIGRLKNADGSVSDN